MDDVALHIKTITPAVCRLARSGREKPESRKALALEFQLLTAGCRLALALVRHVPCVGNLLETNRGSHARESSSANIRPLVVSSQHKPRHTPWMSSISQGMMGMTSSTSRGQWQIQLFQGQSQGQRSFQCRFPTKVLRATTALCAGRTNQTV